MSPGERLFAYLSEIDRGFDLMKSESIQSTTRTWQMSLASVAAKNLQPNATNFLRQVNDKWRLRKLNY
jgi:hypothetical protein